MRKEFASFMMESLGKLVVMTVSMALNHAALMADGFENVATRYSADPGVFLGLGAINLLMAILINRAVPGTVLHWTMGFVLAIVETSILAHLTCSGAGICA